jgi:hypothetical protein
MMTDTAYAPRHAAPVGRTPTLPRVHIATIADAMHIVTISVRASALLAEQIMRGNDGAAQLAAILADDDAIGPLMAVI